MSGDLLPVTLEEEILCVRREIGMRERVYPRFVTNGKMKAHQAEREIAAMRAILARLERVREDAR